MTQEAIEPVLEIKKTNRWEQALLYFYRAPSIKSFSVQFARFNDVGAGAMRNLQRLQHEHNSASKEIFKRHAWKKGEEKNLSLKSWFFSNVSCINNAYGFGALAHCWTDFS